MLWLPAIAVTLVLIVLGKQLWATDEVHSVACYITASASGLWGIALTPIEAQLALGLLVLGGASAFGRQANSLRP